MILGFRFISIRVKLIDISATIMYRLNIHPEMVFCSQTELWMIYLKYSWTMKYSCPTTTPPTPKAACFINIISAYLQTFSRLDLCSIILIVFSSIKICFLRENNLIVSVFHCLTLSCVHEYTCALANLFFETKHSFYIHLKPLFPVTLPTLTLSLLCLLYSWHTIM